MLIAGLFMGLQQRARYFFLLRTRDDIDLPRLDIRAARSEPCDV
jgi:hypothetical protein